MISNSKSLWCLRNVTAGIYLLAAVTLAASTFHTTPALAQTVTVRVGTPNVASDVPLFVAVDKGFFAKYGIQVEFVTFVSAANMIAPMAAGQLDVGAGGLSAGLYNAVERGFGIKAVADKVALPPGSKYFNLLVRKDLVTSGRVKGPADLKGLRIAEAGTATSTTYALSVIAKLGGITYADSIHTNLPFPDHIAALQNQSIDASITVEPLLTRALDAGVATVVKGVDEMVPNLQIAVLLYSEAFAKNRDVAQRFMDAYLEGARYYAGAIKNHRLDGPNAAEVASILTKYTRIKDPAVFRRIAPSEIDPDGRMNTKGMRDMLDFFKSDGLTQGKVSVDDLIDTSFLEQSIKILGPYQPPR